VTDREELSWERFGGAACELAAGITGVECEYVWRTHRALDRLSLAEAPAPA